MNITIKSLIMLCLLAAVGNAHADEPKAAQEPVGGMMGLSFQDDERSKVAKILDEQASRPATGGELSQDIYVLTQERIAETFSRPIPDSINEPTRDD